MIIPFYRHGILSDRRSMCFLAKELENTGCFGRLNNEDYNWRKKVVKSGLNLAEQVVSTACGKPVLLVGHSQGGLVCRVAAIALAGTHLGTDGPFTEQIKRRQNCYRKSNATPSKLGVVTIATPNAGAMTFGQMSVAAELSGRAIVEAAARGGFHNVKDLTTPRLFHEFEKWRVIARYLSISGVCVNRYNRGAASNLAELWPIRRVSVRFDVPNDLVVEDSSTDLRQSLIRPEVDLANCYRHVRSYPQSISLNHSSVRESDEVVNVIVENLNWLFS